MSPSTKSSISPNRPVPVVTPGQVATVSTMRAPRPCPGGASVPMRATLSAADAALIGPPPKVSHPAGMMAM